MGEILGDFVESLLKSLASDGAVDWTVKVVIGVVATVTAIGAGKLIQWTWPRLGSLYASIRNIERARIAVSPESKGLWLAKSIPLRQPADYAARFRTSIPIIVVGNLKGGVGKTTLAANLMAHYAIKKRERVLGIDLDFQGSLTATAMTRHERDQMLEVEAEGILSKAAHLIESGNAFWLSHATVTVADVPNARLVPTYYSLAGVENRVMVEWLIGKRTADVRYHLARILHSEEIQKSFSRVIIDAPPRLTTGCVQALAAATHVLIPTVLDDMSAEAVAAFANQLRVNQAIWPHIKLLGAVGTMTTFNPAPHGDTKDNGLTEFELESLVSAKDGLGEAVRAAEKPLTNTGFLPINCFIPNKAELGRAAGSRIAYASPANTAPLRDIREAFDRLGDEIDRRIAALRSS